MSDITERKLERLYNKVMELEYENELLKERIARATYYMKNNHFYIGAFNAYTQPILDILEGKEKEKQTQK